MYHVMSRGDQRDDIFLEDVDRHEFIKTLAEACQQTDWWVHAFCLMKNHYKSDPMKLALAARLRRETTLSIKQIAGRLNLGKPKGAKSNLHKGMKGPPDDASQPKLDME